METLPSDIVYELSKKLTKQELGRLSLSSKKIHQTLHKSMEERKLRDEIDQILHDKVLYPYNTFSMFLPSKDNQDYYYPQQEKYIQEQYEAMPKKQLIKIIREGEARGDRELKMSLDFDRFYMDQIPISTILDTLYNKIDSLYYNASYDKREPLMKIRDKLTKLIEKAKNL